MITRGPTFSCTLIAHKKNVMAGKNGVAEPSIWHGVASIGWPTMASCEPPQPIGVGNQQTKLEESCP